MDNRIFNINGDGDDLLRSTLYFAFTQAGFATAKGWRISPEKGLILFWYVDEKDKGVTRFPSPVCSDTVMHLVKDYLNNKDTWKNTKFEGFEIDASHDGHNTRGWRVYCEEWGHIEGVHYAFLAIKPMYLWHGK